MYIIVGISAWNSSSALLCLAQSRLSKKSGTPARARLTDGFWQRNTMLPVRLEVKRKLFKRFQYVSMILDGSMSQARPIYTYIYIYLEPEWPLFWSQNLVFSYQNRAHSASRYIYGVFFWPFQIGCFRSGRIAFISSCFEVNSVFSCRSCFSKSSISTRTVFLCEGGEDHCRGAEAPLNEMEHENNKCNTKKVAMLAI